MKTSNTIIYFGLNEFGEYALRYLLKKGIDISTVVIPTENRTKGFEDICNKCSIKLIRLNNDFTEIRKRLKETNPDILVISSFSRILPKDIIYYPRLGAINLHPSLLPKYRGAHPIHWALIDNEKQTGVTIHTVKDKADTGNILAQKKIPIMDTDDINTLIKKLSKEGVSLLFKTLLRLFESPDSIEGRKQNEAIATYAPIRKPEDGKINWKSSSRDIFNMIRTLKHPYPNAFTYSKKREKVTIEASYMPKIHGEVLAKIKGMYLISTSDGVILVKANGNLKVGEILE